MRLKSFRKQLKVFFSLNDTPERIAKGAALGVFISITPTFGIHTILAIGMATFLRTNKAATVLGSFFNNHLSAIPIYLLCYKVGIFITGGDANLAIKPPSFFHYIHLGLNVLIPLWIGSIIVGMAISLPMFFILKYLLKKYKTKR